MSRHRDMAAVEFNDENTQTGSVFDSGHPHDPKLLHFCNDFCLLLIGFRLFCRSVVVYLVMFSFTFTHVQLYHLNYKV